MIHATGRSPDAYSYWSVSGKAKQALPVAARDEGYQALRTQQFFKQVYRFTSVIDLP